MRETLYRDATVWTGVEGEGDAGAVLVRDGRIARVAARLDAPAGAEVVECGGGFLMPAFVDAHTHLVQQGVALMRLSLANVRTLDEAMQSVAARAKMTPEGGWVVGTGFDESKWEGGAMPTSADLDRAAPANPVLLMRVDMHMGVLNSPALKLVGLDAPDGALREEDFYRALDAVKPSPQTAERAVEVASRRAWELGIASCHVVADMDDLAAIEAAHAKGKLGVRTTMYYREVALDAAAERGLRRGDGDDWVRTGGCKLFADGSIGSRTATVSKGYADDPLHRGQPVYPPGRLAELAHRARGHGLQLAVHAIGDLAVEEALGALEALDDRPGRHRIEHVEVFTDAQAARMAAAGVVASVQPNFIGEWGHPGMMYESRLGPWAVGGLNRLAVLRDAGVRLAFGSDHMPWGPLYGVHCAVNAPTPTQRLTVDETLRAYTAGAAWAGFAEERLGALAPGRLADLVLLDADPRRSPTRIRDLEVRRTVVDGRTVVAR